MKFILYWLLLSSSIFLKSFHYLPEKVWLSIKLKIFSFKIHVKLWSSGIRYFDYYCKKIRILGQFKSWSYHDESSRKSNRWLCSPIKTGKQEKIIVVSNLWDQIVSLQYSVRTFQILTKLSSTCSRGKHSWGQQQTKALSRIWRYRLCTLMQ